MDQIQMTLIQNQLLSSPQVLAHQRERRQHQQQLKLHKLGMRKARDMPINVVDISAKDQMSQAQHVRMAMGANGGQPKPVNLASIEHLKPSLGQKRKHNIMSLAYQAKANEQQLNASWAASRRTKAETQSKYGF
ncbi:proline-rich protein [Lobosporangium transversale]|uniref:Proline-rich protein n=1 Tax=Lobosporangium transversale TaxID=64571 RepID=A0A1Y2H380_9FUNG|nr:proline-rich protein [Lobosporangium transversale]ORZ29010.1 proline-rich protein [Lobosporangium transversale]|eukprot:XP_021886683.1 proline-rich protein [Lobosporangium transversale]